MYKIDRELCIECGKCIDICPMTAINNLMGYTEIDNNRCSKCKLCLSVCPVSAIKYGMY